MSRLMDKTKHENQEPKLRNIVQVFVGKVEIKCGIGADEVPVSDKNSSLEDKQQQNRQQAPTVVDVFAKGVIEPGQVPIRVPGGKGDVCDVDFRLGTAFSLRHQLFAHGQILFLVSLVPEFGL